MTTITLATLPLAAPPSKPAVDASASDESKSTFITLGKRTRKASQQDDLVAEICPPRRKRAKDARECALSDEAVSQSGVSTRPVACAVPERVVKSAPTSFNGSTNPNPSLDILISLPQGDFESSDGESNQRKEKRLLQNRKSAQKCRQKKKVQIGHLREDFSKVNNENEGLKFQINQISLLLYQKIEENTLLQNQLEQVAKGQTQQMALQQMVALQALSSAASSPALTQSQAHKVVPVKIQQQSAAVGHLASSALSNLLPRAATSLPVQAAVQPTAARRAFPSLSAFKMVAKQPEVTPSELTGSQ